MASSSTREESFTLSSALPPRNYDVFLSFNGGDTRRNFTDHLLAALTRDGFSTFRDDDALQRGEGIGPKLMKAIEESRIIVIVFSRNYAASRWCLDELVEIMKCKGHFGQIVVPVYYDVDPSDVRKQTGSFGRAFREHEEHYRGRGMEGKVQMWRAALVEVANLAGWDLRSVADGRQSTLIEKIVEGFSNKLILPLNVAKYPIGLESRVQDLNMLLSLGSDDVRIVGIWGIVGIGKTTIAKALYNLIHHKFEGCSFLSNVGEISKQPNGLVGLQEQLLSDILMNENVNISNNVERGISVIMERLRHRRVLVVLDDVDNFYQLEALALRHDWFNMGSRIIVTTRDEYLLKKLRVDGVYMPTLLSPNESFQLFSWHAFRKDDPIEDYVELSREVVDYAGGLPLALEDLGSFLFGKTIPVWKSTLEKLRVIPHDAVQKRLKTNFDSLNEEEKNLFLDIACFFVEMNKNYAIRILEGCGYSPNIGLAVLSDRCLVRVDGDSLTMPDMLRDMGREIVRREHREEPGKRSRLWFRVDVLDVLNNHTGTKAVEGLVLNLPKSNGVQVDAQAFASMKRLRLVQLNYVYLSGSYVHLSQNLRWLCWFGFPLKSIPSDLFMEKVVVIDMRYSKLKQVWKGRKILNKLKILNLSHSHHLTETPDFSACASLEMLFLNDCTSLVRVHQSIECLKKLVVLDLESCKNLRKLPLGIWKLTSLQNLSLSGCSKLENLLGFKESPSKSWCSLFSFQADFKESLSKSWFSPFSISAFPVRNLDSISEASIEGLISLRRLEMANCNLSYVPSKLGDLISLEWLNLEGNIFCTLPDSISRLSRLRDLSLRQCAMLQSLPELPVNLEIVDARHCTSLERISIGSDFRKLPLLYFPCCYKLAGNILASNFRRCLLQNQELHAVGGFSILFPGDDFPDYFNYQSVGSVLSFIVSDRKIRGWTLCIVIAGCVDIRAEPDAAIVCPLLYQVKNKTKGVERNYGPAFHDLPLYRQDHMWLCYATQHYLELQMEAGDEMEYSFFITGRTQISVKKCGVNLVYENDETNHPTNDQAMNQYSYPSSADVILDNDDSADQGATDNMVVRHSNVSVSLFMSVCVLCLSVFVSILLYAINIL